MENQSLLRGRNALIVWIVILGVIALTSLPYWIASNSGGESHEFIGFLLNPVDGNTYLAKMRQGLGGDWRFQLPYTAEQGEGAYIFLFYIGLGHLARITNLELLTIFQVSRIAATVIMLLSLARCYSSWLPSSREARYAFILAAFGTGMGWLLLPLGAFTADFWVAEAFPFLSAYANPHFPLSIALIAAVITPTDRIRYLGIGSLFLGILLGMISPFAWVISLAVLGGLAGFYFLESRRLLWPAYRFIWMLLGGGALVLYSWAAVLEDPILAGWNSQNFTPTPPLWDLLISFSPAILVGILGGWTAVRRRKEGGIPYLIWLVFALAAIYLPLDLQRRLLVGLFVPICALAAMGISRISEKSPRWSTPAGILVFAFSIPTTLLVLLAGIHGARSLDPALYLSRAEGAAYRWIQENTLADAVILGSPETGLFLPGLTGRRVIYGHPFETVQAEVEKEAVEAFFSGRMTPEAAAEFLSERGIDYIFHGPREMAIGDQPALESLEILYDRDQVRIYAP